MSMFVPKLFARPLSGRNLLAVVFAMMLISSASASFADVTKKQATDLANQIETAMNAGDGTVFDAAIDMDALGGTVTSGIAAPQGLAQGFIVGLKKGSLAQAFLTQIKEGSTYKFLHVRGTPAKPTILFRMAGTGGLNYHEMYLATDAAGKVRVNDIYIAMTGELFSQTLRKLYLPLAANENKGKIAKLLTADSDIVKNLDNIKKLTELTRTHKPKEALAVYDALPASLKNDKTFMLQRVINLMNLGEEKPYQEAIETYEKSFPNDQSLLLVGLDGYFLRKEWDKALTNIDALDKSVGGDPYLNLFRSTVMTGKNDPAGARKYLTKLADAEPALAQAYYSLLDLSLAAKDYKETARLLDLAAEKANVGFPNIQNVQEFAGFLKSPEGKAWLKSQPAAEPADPAKP